MKSWGTIGRVHVAKGFRKNYRCRRSPREKERRSKLITGFSAIVFAMVLVAYVFVGNDVGMETLATKEIVRRKDISLVVEEEKDGLNSMSNETKEDVVEESSYKKVADEYLEQVSAYKVAVLLEDGSIEEIPVESYVAGVVASEMPSSFGFEALKAQAVAARTYVEAQRRGMAATGAGRHDGACVCSTSCCQVYQDVLRLGQSKSQQWLQTDYNKIKNAVVETAGQYLYYDGELVTQPLFFSASGGSTENSEDVFVSAVPYLRSVSSSLENVEKYDGKKTDFTYEQLNKKIEEYIRKHPDASSPADYDLKDLPLDLCGADIYVESRTSGGGAALLRFGEITLTGGQVRELLSLPSADITVQKNADTVTFITQGNGHRVGMSQYGADAMADQGNTYKEILAHYYTGTKVSKLKG